MFAAYIGSAGFIIADEDAGEARDDAACAQFRYVSSDLASPGGSQGVAVEDRRGHYFRPMEGSMKRLVTTSSAFRFFFARMSSEGRRVLIRPVTRVMSKSPSCFM